MKQWFTLFSLSLVFSVTTLAQDGNGSQFQYQTPANQFELTPALEFSGMTFKNPSTASFSELKRTTVTEYVMAEYGLNEMFSVGALWGAAERANDYEPNSIRNTHSVGFLDPNLFAKGRLFVGPGSLRFGTNLTVAVERYHIYSDANTNISNGGIHMIPFVGYEVEINRNLFGARFSYEFKLMNDKVVANDISGTRKGGENFQSDLFYEYHLSRVIIGGALELVNHASERIDFSSGTSQLWQESTSEYRIKAYVPVRLSSRATILPSLTYGVYAAFDTSDTDTITEWDLNVPIRIVF